MPLKLYPDDRSPAIVIDTLLARVGRDDASDLCLKDSSVSRQHAEIESRDGEWFVFDLNSSNGIRVDGDPVPSARLLTGQRLEIGRVGFRVEVAADAWTENATMTFDRPPELDEGPGRTMIAAAPPPPPRIVYQPAPRSSEFMNTLTTVVVAVALALLGVEAYNTFAKGSDASAPPKVDSSPPADAVAVAPVAPVASATIRSRPQAHAAVGAILISTDLPATVSIDGLQATKLGTSALKRFEVTPGDHVVRFKSDDWEAEVFTRVAAGEQKLIRPTDDPALTPQATPATPAATPHS